MVTEFILMQSNQWRRTVSLVSLLFSVAPQGQICPLSVTKVNSQHCRASTLLDLWDASLVQGKDHEKRVAKKEKTDAVASQRYACKNKQTNKQTKNLAKPASQQSTQDHRWGPVRDRSTGVGPEAGKQRPR